MSILDIIGASLTIIGFFGLAERLERFFRIVKLYGRGTRNHALREIALHRPFTDHSNYWLKTCGQSALQGIIALTVVYLVMPEEAYWFAWFQDLPWQGIVIGVASVIFALMVFTFVFTIIWLQFVMLASEMIWRVFTLLAKPKGGVLGSIGLLVMLGSVFLGW